MTTTVTTTTLERKQWHGPYFGSMRLELKENGEGCEYDGEYILNTKALQIDMLARTKGEITWVLDEITQGFRRHNIIEFKSPDDALDLDVFYKTLGYGCLYKAQGSHVNAIHRMDISVTFIRERKPEKLLQELAELYDVVERAPGIYMLQGEGLLFAVQILVLREMTWEKHIWVTALQRQITREHARLLLLEMRKLEKVQEREWADSVLQLAIANNKEIFERLKGDEFMCQALRELMAEEIDEELYKARCIGEKEGEKRGEEKGQKSLGEVIKRLLSGEDKEKIRHSGVSEKTLDWALEVLGM